MRNTIKNENRYGFVVVNVGDGARVVQCSRDFCVRELYCNKDGICLSRINSLKDIDSVSPWMMGENDYRPNKIINKDKVNDVATNAIGYVVVGDIVVFDGIRGNPMTMEDAVSVATKINEIAKITKIDIPEIYPKEDDADENMFINDPEAW